MYRTDASEDRSLLVTAFRGRVFALDRVTGQIRWKVEPPDFDVGPLEIVFGQGVVLAVSGRHLTFVDYASGRVLKRIDRKERGAGGRPIVIVDGEQLFIGSSGSVACYSLNGDFLWEQYFTGEGFGEPAIGLPGNVRQADDRGSR